MDVHISLEGRRDLVGQIYQQVRDAILDGRLKAGEIVPPTRELARRLTVSRNTVGVAYDRLIGEGFIETRRGAGTYVREHSVASASPETAADQPGASAASAMEHLLPPVERGRQAPGRCRHGL